MGRAATSARALAGLLASAALAVAALGPNTAAAPEPELRVAILPCTNIETSFQKFHPLFSYMRTATGFRFTLLVPADMADFEAHTRNGQVDFALQDPHTFKELWHLFDESSLLQTRSLDGGITQSAVVVVRRDAGISELSQLLGKTVMFGPRVSSPKWVAARLLFESAGIDVDRDLKVLNGGCCEDIAFTVVIRSVDAGVICDHFLAVHGTRQKDLGVDASALTTIGRTAPLPTRIFAARKGIAAEVTEAVTRALLELEPGKAEHAEALAGAEIGGFLRTTRAAYLEPFERVVAEERR